MEIQPSLLTVPISAGLVLLLAATAAAQDPLLAKKQSVLFPTDLARKAKANVAEFPWAAAIQKNLADGAARWMNTSDDELWDFMFGPAISRSWMVWSDGFCPSCKKDVKMYTWKIAAWDHPWKVQCPHCGEFFPKNDFTAFYRSGLDEQGVFQPAKADRSLLFNAEHPGPDDPLRSFGVDDGEGYLDSEGRRWRFIGAYLLYGQWKQRIVSGAQCLSEAYLATGDPICAHKTIVLLDRIADLFPAFDFSTQGHVYEERAGPVRGQVSTWHDACEEVRQLALAYDRVFEAARGRESELTAFLASKAATHKLENPKKTWADIQRNIEDRIFRDTLAHRERIESNYPTTDRTMLIIKTVLEWPGNREEIMGLLDAILDKATSVDGLSGEKGLAGYSTIAPRAMAELLEQFARIEPDFLKAIYDRHPSLHAMYRFHIETMCLDAYYPQIGDSGGFGQRCVSYAGATFSKNPGAGPSAFTFFRRLYELTRDPAFAQIIYRENGDSVADLPHDLFADAPAAFQKDIQNVIDREGARPVIGSVNKQQWRLAILRSGTGDRARAVWMDYDAGERHSHADGMNIGLFAKGLDLFPEFGYPPVGYGGWSAPKAVWYTKTAAHNTVVVDGHDQQRVNSGTTTLWADGRRFRAIHASDPAMIDGGRYDRLIAMIDLDDEDSYVVDVFQVAGGRDHAKFTHAFFGTVETMGLALKDTDDYGFATEMRRFRRDDAPDPGWSVDWAIEDYYTYFSTPRPVHLRYTDLTEGASASLAEAWIDVAQFGGEGGMYIPCVMTRRAASDGAPLASTFVAVVEPYEGASKIAGIRRAPVYGLDGVPAPESVALAIECTDGRRDLCMVAGNEAGKEMKIPDINAEAIAALAHITHGADGCECIVLCQGSRLKTDNVELALRDQTGFIEIALEAGKARVLFGDKNAIQTLVRNGKELEITAAR
ncbi:MAG TPA: heparinase II/III family protein [Candidatus Hydrogenedentes bacterium]|nr:heparinase II/III family protein [Candidatus Hydrogenedentota bacterium]HRT64130.1 heparinase II/III family protein [Candidatus Hydrogenedentota bacterium]